jgi:hypothetical protein
MTDFITAQEAKALATPAFPIRVSNYLGEVNKAICEAATGGLSYLDLRIPLDIHEDVIKAIREKGFQVIPSGEPVQGMIFFRVGWR